MSEKFEKLIKSFQNAVSGFLPGFSTDRQEIDNARDALVAYVARLEEEVERLREEIEAIGKAHHKDIVILGGLYLENKSLKAENARLRDAARWIPVEERLPEPLIPVDVVMDGMVTNLMLSPDKETWMNVAGWPYSASSITHWRALPEPPEVK